MPSDSPAVATAKNYLLHCIRGKTDPDETRHPWRKSWEFVYFHSLRVDAICQKLLAAEAPDMPPAEVLALRLAAILHDIGRLDDRKNHARLGAQLAADWLSATHELAGLVGNPELVVDLIAHHPEKNQPGPTLCHALLKDADALDEIGMFSILMATDWLDPASPCYFYDLAGRLEQFEIPFCDRIATLLQTNAGRAYLAQKRRFIEAAIAQLSLEFEGIPREIEQLINEALLPNPTQADVRAALAAANANADSGKALPLSVGPVQSITPLGGAAFLAETPAGSFVVRFARSKEELAALRKEERIVAGLRNRITLRLPDTRLAGEEGQGPVFAIHSLVPGQPLTGEIYAALTPGLRDRLVRDLVRFFREMHAVWQSEAASWVEAGKTKPVWFSGSAPAEIRCVLVEDSPACLDARQQAALDETIRAFAELPARPGLLVFGHGDLHGFNMAIEVDSSGPRLTGVFDLGCAGILDIHEDFFRLALVSEDLLARVLEEYQFQTGRADLDPARCAVYYRAFLFYLMAEQDEQGRDHLKAMLDRHLMVG